MYCPEGTINDQNLAKHVQVMEFVQDGNLKSVTMVENVVGNSGAEKGIGFFNATYILYTCVCVSSIDVWGII